MSESAGQQAYEEDVRRRPLYDDGSPRITWDDLGEVEQSTWHRNPTPRGTVQERVAERSCEWLAGKLDPKEKQALDYIQAELVKLKQENAELGQLALKRFDEAAAMHAECMRLGATLEENFGHTELMPETIRHGEFAKYLSDRDAQILRQCSDACLAEKVDAEATGEASDKAYNAACDHCSDAIKELDPAKMMECSHKRAECMRHENAWKRMECPDCGAHWVKMVAEDTFTDAPIPHDKGIG